MERKNISFSTESVDREAIHIERELQAAFGGLQTKSTKTIGAQMAGRIGRLVGVASDLVERRSGTQAAAYNALRRLRWVRPQTRREEAMETLSIILNTLADWRVSLSSLRIEELQFQVQQLRAQLEGIQGDGGPSSGSESATSKPSDLSSASTVFVIMPFAESLTDVWRGGILRAASAQGFQAVRVDMINRSSDITDDIIESINRCHVAIVDVTGNNANVMFELGYAIAKDKPLIIISQSAEFLPFDIRQIRTIVYSNTWSGTEELNNRIQEFLKEFKGHRVRAVKLKKRGRKPRLLGHVTREVTPGNGSSSSAR